MKLKLFSTDFRKILPIYFTRIRPVGAEFFLADGRTDMTKLVVAFRNFVNAKKIYISKNIKTIFFRWLW